MFRILDRYILREAAQTWVSVTGVLLAILLSNQFARVLGDAARDKIAKDAVFSVIGLTALQYLTILIPFGLFLAVMLALARLYSDSELPAMMACRVGPGGLYRPVAWLALPLAALVAWLALVIAPQSLAKIEVIGAETQRRMDLSAIEAGRFVEAGDEGTVIFAEQIDGDGSLVNVFLQRRLDNEVEVVLAKRGTQRNGDDDVRYIVLSDGRRYLGVPGAAQFQIVEFTEYGLPFTLPAAEVGELKPEAKSTAELLGTRDPLEIAELQWRVSVPLATLVLALLAVPLSRSQPRQGRYGKLAIGVLVFIIYFNLIGAAKVWVEREQIDPRIGIWFVHAAMAFIAMAMVASQNGWFGRFRPSRWLAS
ncbi:MAG: LPS export ABC transporter permease LptF [Pseudomonadota bacterium]